jgi:hypothetical protein
VGQATVSASDVPSRSAPCDKSTNVDVDANLHQWQGDRAPLDSLRLPQRVPGAFTMWAVREADEKLPVITGRLP